jgi:hypothetical protein
MSEVPLMPAAWTMLTIGCYTVAAVTLLAIISRGLERVYRRRPRR